MGHYRTAPTYDQPIVIGTNTSSVYYRWIQDVDLGVPPSNEIPITITGSPFIYSPTAKGGVIVQGGTVTSVAVARSGTFYPTGMTQGLFTLAANDQLQVIFTAMPFMVFLPA